MKPWIMSKKQWEINPPTGYKYNPNIIHEAINKRVIMEDGSVKGNIEVGDKFFKLKINERKHVILHELGHDFERNLTNNNPELFWKISDSGIFGKGKITQTDKPYYDGILGTYNCNEAMAESYSVYYDEPDFLKTRHLKAYKFIDRIVKGEKPELVLNNLLGDFNMENPRPPKEWFDSMLKIIKKEYPRRKASWNTIVAGIWWKQYDQATRDKIIKNIDSASLKPKPKKLVMTGNPEMLECPFCGVKNPVNKAGVYLKCKCGKNLVSVKIRHKR